VNNFKKYFCLFILSSAVLSTVASAYVQNVTTNYSTVRWPSNVTLIDVYTNPSNTQGMLEADILSQASASVAQWNGHSSISIRANSSSVSNQANVNEIYFSTDPSIFNGTGVVGITQVLFKNNTGEILEADILLNDNFTFSDDVNDTNYLGNVITHELGHFLGLGHSQVIGSTMFYALTRGQSTLAPDDKAGVYSSYSNGDSTKGTLTGNIVGGQGVVPVFGANVQAISVTTGEIAGATISELDGSFSIQGLAKNDQYYIYTYPVVQAGLPSKYANAKSDFCESSKKYRGSFFQACGSSFEGYPQSVKLNSSSIDVGNITIRCGLDVPVGYLQGKNLSPASFDMLDGVVSGVGNGFVGYFSNSEISQGDEDYFKVDLSNVDLDAISPTGDLYLELKIMSQTLYSPLKANIEITRNSGTTTINPKVVTNSDGWLSLDTIARIQINRSDLSDNEFEIKLTPEALAPPTYFPSGVALMKEDFFPSYPSFQDSLYMYLASASIVKDNGNGTYSLMSSKNDQLTDNTQCTDAINTYALSDYSANRSVASTGRSRKKKGIFGCGTIDLEGGSTGGGPGGFFIGLVFSLLLCSLTSSIIKQYKSKQYSKMA
jgi:predicted Zn-dependent protease